MREISSESVKVVYGSIVNPPLCIFVTSVDILEATEFLGQTMTQVDLREIRKQQLNDTF